MSFYRKARTLIGGDIREIENNWIQYHNQKVIEKYKEKEDIYCVIRLFSDEGGLFCLYFKALAGINYSIQNGYIPVIDMQTKENIFVSKEDRKTVNAWEYFFEQPYGITFQEIKNKPNKIIIENPMLPCSQFELFMANNRIAGYWRELARKYTRCTKAVQEEIDKYLHFWEDNDKFVGVLARGTDYLNAVGGHPVQPDMKTLIAETKAIMKEYQCNKIFLATEDLIILDAMQEAFEGQVYYVNQKRYKGQQKDKLAHLEDYKTDAIEMNIAYLAAMYLLARCNCFFGSATTGTTGVFLLTQQFEHFRFWYDGTYGVTDEKSIDINKL